MFADGLVAVFDGGGAEIIARWLPGLQCERNMPVAVLLAVQAITEARVCWALPLSRRDVQGSSAPLPFQTRLP